MSLPHNFSWVDAPLLSASAFPWEPAALHALRNAGIEILLTLTEQPVRDDWMQDAGLLSVHVPVPDMDAPSPAQMQQCVDIIRKATNAGMGINVHCFAGMGRTGTILAAWLIADGETTDDAIRRIRTLRPNSIESIVQEEALRDYESRRKRAD